MIIFEHCPYLTNDPIRLDMHYDNSLHFKQLFHFHPGIEIIFVHEGYGQLIVEQGMYEVKPGTLLFLKPFQPHYLQMKIDKDQPYVRSLIKYDYSFFSEYLKSFSQLKQFHDQLCSDAATLQVQHMNDWKRFEHFLLDSYGRMIQNPHRNRMEGNALFVISILSYLFPLWKKEAAVSPQKQQHAEAPIASKMIRWINEHYQHDFQLEALAQAVHVSPNYASHMFRKETGKTIMEFLTDRRIKQACILLKTTASPVQEVGEKSGWPNFNYFCSIFKKRMGMTPKQYRYH
ncbi:MAG: hypothetical protein K0Q59_3664 [Paenibacillus sp.]|nr:hypothetical protein [Paenibacillus sp.]